MSFMLQYLFLLVCQNINPHGIMSTDNCAIRVHAYVMTARNKPMTGLITSEEA